MDYNEFYRQIPEGHPDDVAKHPLMDSFRSPKEAPDHDSKGEGSEENEAHIQRNKYPEEFIYL